MAARLIRKEEGGAAYSARRSAAARVQHPRSEARGFLRDRYAFSVEILLIYTYISYIYGKVQKKRVKHAPHSL